MLDPLSRVSGVDNGVGVVTVSGSSSDLFLQLHYCSIFLKSKKRVVVISSNLAESNYRVIFSKLALRWDPSLISVIDLDSLLDGQLHINEENTAKRLNEEGSFIDSLLLISVAKMDGLALQQQSCLCSTQDRIKVVSFRNVPIKTYLVLYSNEVCGYALSTFVVLGSPSLLIFDDVSVLERLNMRSSTVVCLLYKLYSKLEPNGLLLALFSLKTRAFSMMLNKADFVIEITPVGSGFGKDVSGRMVINVRGATLTPDVSELLYVTGERSIKCFYPGGSSFLNL